MPSVTVSKGSNTFVSDKRFLKASNKQVPADFVNVAWIMAEVKQVVCFSKKKQKEPSKG